MDKQEYMKKCSFCKQEIRMTEKLGKWYAVEILGDSYHRCGGNKKEKQKPELKSLLEAQVLLQELSARVKRLEQIVIDPRPR